MWSHLGVSWETESLKDPQYSCHYPIQSMGAEMPGIATKDREGAVGIDSLIRLKKNLVSIKRH